MIAEDDIRGTFWYADQCIYHHHNGQPLVFNATLNFGARIEGVALQQWNIQQVGAAAEVTDAQLEAAVDEVIEGKLSINFLTIAMYCCFIPKKQYLVASFHEYNNLKSG